MTTSSRSSISWFARACSSLPHLMRVVEVSAYLVAYDVVQQIGARWIWQTLRARSTRDAPAPVELVTALASALDTAGAFYAKPVKCLQRAVVATWYLRNRGYDCLLVVGAHVARKEGHAWVEANGQILGDPRHLRRFFRPLARV
jgi:Transglutaminase-like superfamily